MRLQSVRPAIGGALLALFVIIGGAFAWRAAGTSPASAGEASPLSLLLDCDTATAGVQENCTYPDGTSTMEVALVLANAGPAVTVAGFDTTIVSTPRSVFAPIAPACPAPATSCNPDFNNEGLGVVNWDCSSPMPAPDLNRDSDAGTSESFIACVNLGTGLAVPANGQVTLAYIRYAVADDVVANLSVQNSGVYSPTFDPLGGCTTSEPLPPMVCGTATVAVGTNPTTPTFTPSPTHTPTITPTPSPAMTPPGTPTGAVTDGLLLNQSVCIGAGSLLAGLEPITAALGCQGMARQAELQRFIHCLTGGEFCPNHPPGDEIFQTVEPVDFAEIDLDGDSIQGDQPLLVMAFVDARYPVFFETDHGTFLSAFGDVEGPSVLCYGAEPGSEADPDCFDDPTRPGDGVVVKRLFMNGDQYRGPATVTVTQNGVSKQLPFTVTGSAKTVAFGSMDGRTDIETGALMSAPGTTGGGEPNSCHGAITGDDITNSTRKTNVFMQALDDQGTPVVGALVQWDRVFPTYPGIPGRSDTRSPQGGVSLVSNMTFALDGLGVGGIMVACGGDAPGLLSVQGSFLPVLNPAADSNYRAAFTIPVVAPTNTPPVALEAEDGMVGINYGVCYAIRGNTDCQGLLTQGRTSERGTMQGTLCRFRGCTPALTPRITDATGDDFAPVNADGNRLSPGQGMYVIAFIPGTGPVTFTTTKGVLYDEFGPRGTTFTCTTEDPDCVAGSPDGDGIVTVALVATEGDPRGSGEIMMQQGTHTDDMDFELVGSPVSMTIEAPHGTPALELNESTCDFPYTAAGAVDRAQRGYSELTQTTRIIRILDDQGTDVVGVPLDFVDDDFPVRTYLRATMTLGTAGIGALAVFCSQNVPGTFAFDVAVGVAGPAQLSTVQIKVGESCTNDLDCDAVTDATDNCESLWNPQQDNSDRNFTSGEFNTVPAPARTIDDLTRPVSDEQGDACDSDDDNDGLLDVSERYGALCGGTVRESHSVRDDTDGDRFLDGAECALGRDPRNDTDTPELSECGPDTPLRFGFLNARTRFCLYGLPTDGEDTDDTDEDGILDVCEIASINQDRVVNVGDIGLLGLAMHRGAYLRHFDINRDGALNVADRASMAMVSSARVCQQLAD